MEIIMESKFLCPNLDEAIIIIAMIILTFSEHILFASFYAKNFRLIISYDKKTDKKFPDIRDDIDFWLLAYNKCIS